MKSESKKFEPKEQLGRFFTEPITKPKVIEPKAPLKKWLITFELYRLTQSILYDKGTRVVEAENLEKAFESMKRENLKLVITLVKDI